MRKQSLKVSIVSYSGMRARANRHVLRTVYTLPAMAFGLMTFAQCPRSSSSRAVSLQSAAESGDKGGEDAFHQAAQSRVRDILACGLALCA